MPLLLAGGGCETPAAGTPDTSLRSFKPIHWACADTPQTRKEVIAHNSVYATLKRGKKVVYADDCPKKEDKVS
jgi:hypothetical protein